MSTTAYGPVPVSQVKVESKRIFDVLSSGRQVLLSRHGRVVAVIDPPERVPPELLVDYVLPGHRELEELTATQLNQSSPSSAISAAELGQPSYLTKDGRVYGLLRELGDDELAELVPSADRIAELERRIDAYLRDHSAVTADELAKATERIDREIGESHCDDGSSIGGLVGDADFDLLHDHFSSCASAFATRTATFFGSQPHSADYELFVETMRARTLEAMTRLTAETVAAAVRRDLYVRSVTHRTIAVAEGRASSAFEHFRATLSERGPQRDETASR